MTVEGKYYYTHRIQIHDQHTNDGVSRLPQAQHFQGEGGPEDKIKMESEQRPGDEEVPNLQDLKRHGVAQ